MLRRHHSVPLFTMATVVEKAELVKFFMKVDRQWLHFTSQVELRDLIWGEKNPHELYEHERDSPKVTV